MKLILLYRARLGGRWGPLFAQGAQYLCGSPDCFLADSVRLTLVELHNPGPETLDRRGRVIT